MSGFFSQLSLWEIGGLLLVIVILNTVLLKWFMDWNQSHPLDEADTATASPGPARRGAASAAALGSARASLGGAAAAAAGGALESGAGDATAVGRPRRRKYLQPETGGAGLGESVIARSADTNVPASFPGAGAAMSAGASASAAAATVVPLVMDPAPAAVGKGQPASPEGAPVVPGRSFAEVSKGASEPVKLSSRPVVPGPGLLSTEPKPLADLKPVVPAAGVAATPVVAKSGTGSEAPASERASAARLPERNAPPVSGRPQISRSEILAKGNPRAGSILNKVGLGSAAPAAPQVVSAAADAPSAALSEGIGGAAVAKPEAPVPAVEEAVTPAAFVPRVSEKSAETEDNKPAPDNSVASILREPVLVPEVTSSLSLSKAGPKSDPFAARTPAAQPDDGVSKVSPVASAAAGSAPAPVAPVTAPKPDDSGAGSSVAPAAETPGSAEASGADEPVDPATSSADSDSMPTSSSTDKNPADPQGTPGGRPVIARRSVGPARIFLTREFSSLRIKSALTPPSATTAAPQTPEPAASAVAPADTPGAPSTASEPGEGTKLTGYEPIETSDLSLPSASTEEPAASVEPTPSASLQVSPLTQPEPTPTHTSEPSHAAHEEQTVSAQETATNTASPEPATAPAEELPTVAAGALGVEPEVEDQAPDHVAAIAPQDEPIVAAESAEPEPMHQSAEPESAEAPVAAEAAPEPAPAAEIPEPTPGWSTPAPDAGAGDSPQPFAAETESAEDHSEPVDNASAPAMLAPVSSSGSIASAVSESTAPAPATNTTSTVSPLPFIMTSAPTTSGERATAQLTFSFEVASLQLTPSFRLGSVQLRPLTNVVTLHLAQGEGQASQSPLSANIAFEILAVQTGGGTGHGPVQSIVLKPLSEARAATTPQPKLAVNAVQLSQGSEGSAPIQITPAQSTSTSVQLLATFAIAGIDFTPLFEIGSMRLEPTTSSVLLRLSQGAQASGMELPPSFELMDVQVNGEGQINSMLLVPRAG